MNAWDMADAIRFSVTSEMPFTQTGTEIQFKMLSKALGLTVAKVTFFDGSSEIVYDQRSFKKLLGKKGDRISEYEFTKIEGELPVPYVKKIDFLRSVPDGRLSEFELTEEYALHKTTGAKFLFEN